MALTVIYCSYYCHMLDTVKYEQLRLQRNPLEFENEFYADGTHKGVPPASAALLTNTELFSDRDSIFGACKKAITVYSQTDGVPSSSESNFYVPENYIIGPKDSYTGRATLVYSLGAPEKDYRWLGGYSLKGLPASPSAPITAAIKPRRFIQGFEIGNNGSAATVGSKFSRDASRTSEGKGLAIRSMVNNTPINMIVDAAGKSSSWERFYIRVRKFPASGEIQFWSMEGTVESGAAAHLTMSSTGTITAYNMGNQTYPGTSMGTFGPIALNEWIKIDLLIKYAVTLQASPAIISAGEFDLFINGTQPISGRPVTGGGLALVALHQSSKMGNTKTTANVMEMDVDDWFNADYITLSNFRSDAIDWKNGSHIELIRPTAFGSGHSVNWTGDVRVLSANPVIGMLAATTVEASVASSRMEVETDYRDKYAGCPAFEVFWFPKVATGVTSQLGWSIYSTATSAYVDTLTSRTIADEVWEGVLYTVTAATSTACPELCPKLAGTETYQPLKLVYVKNSATGSQEVQALQAQAEFLGFFAKEDLPPADVFDGSALTFPARYGPHNSPYPTIGQSFSPESPAAPFLIMSGTYTGNGTGQDIQLAAVPHFWWVRPLTGADATNGVRWWSSMTAAHGALDKKYAANRMIRACQTENLGPYLQVAGAGTQSNANGVVYQYIAVHDPGMRYMINGAFSHLSTDASHANALPDTRFTPTGVFSFYEDDATSANGVWFKGPGHESATASPLSATETTTALTVAQGILTSAASFHSNQPQTAYSAWRAADENAVTGAVAITTYEGDGTGARDITLALGGKCPLFALVVPHNGASYFRDPSHTTTNSSLYNSGTLSTTAIVGGGPNTISVDTTLNATGIDYEVFALPGGITTAATWAPNPATTTNPGYIPPGGSAPTDPLQPVSTAPRTGGPWGPGAIDTGGWWESTDGYVSDATLIVTPDVPKHPRTWAKIAAFSALFGGSPGPSVVHDNRLIYAGDDYTLGTDQPTIRMFDGTVDTILTTIPNTTASVIPNAIMSMLLENGVIYIATFDSGTTSANYAGRVFAYNIEDQTYNSLGSGFSGGEVPYALAWHLGRLWVGTNQSDAATGKVYFIRPGIDADWTTDYTMSDSTVGGVTSMLSYKGALYVGSDNVAGTFAKILVRAVAGTYSTSYTVTGGTAAANNGVLFMKEFKDNLYAFTWNPDTTVVSKIVKFDGTNWSNAYVGATTTLRPYIAAFTAVDPTDEDNYLFVVGGGSAYQASLVSSPDGVTWTDLTAYLAGPVTETALPITGVLTL